MQEITFDAFDIRLLNALQGNARLTSLELAERVHLSASQCQRRLKKLEDSGVIERYSAQLNREKAGFGVMAIVNVTLEKHGRQRADEFRDSIQSYPQILECWATTGDADYFLKLVAEDLNAFSAFVLDELLNMDIVASVRSSLLLRELKNTTALPVWAKA